MVLDIRPTTDGTVDLPSVSKLIRQLRAARVAVEEPQHVRSFLLAHPHVAPALPNLIDQLRDQLGSDTELRLEVDRSSGVGNEYLVLLVRHPQYDEHALGIMREASLAILKLNRQDPKFLVTSDFVAASSA
jgi:hypothetical protein